MVDVPNNATTTAVLETATGPFLVGTYSGRIETGGDHDWIRVNFVVGTTYSIFASSQPVGALTQGDPTLSIRNSNGQQVLFDDDGGVISNAYLSITASVTGVYYIDVGESFSYARGAYTVEVTSVSATNNVSSASASDDVLTGTAGERVVGGWGDDIIYVGNGVDALGEQGDDSLHGNTAANFLSGGIGNDYADGNVGADLIFGNAGNDELHGDDDNDQLFGGEGFDDLYGGSGADTLTGGPGGDYLDGEFNVDQAAYGGAAAGVVADLQSSAGNTGDAEFDIYVDIENLFGSGFGDTLRGNSGANYLKGEAGADTLVGRLGRDILAGGLNNDVFLFNGVTDSGVTDLTRDVITDFVKGQDKINLAAIDANTGTATNDAFGLLAKGTSASAVATGWVGYYWFDPAGTINDKTILRINNDGDATIEMTVELRGLITLAVADFNL